MKRVFSSFLTAAVCGAFALAPVISAESVNGISADTQTAAPGDSFTVTVNVPAAENADTASVKIDYDETVFTVTDWLPELPGGLSGSGNGVLALSAANIDRVIDLSGGLSFTAQMKVRDDAVPGSYKFTLSEHSFCYVLDNGYEFGELWFPDITETTVTVTGEVPAENAAQTEPPEEISEETVSASETEAPSVQTAGTKAAAEQTAGTEVSALKAEVSEEPEISVSGEDDIPELEITPPDAEGEVRDPAVVAAVAAAAAVIIIGGGIWAVKKRK